MLEYVQCYITMEGRLQLGPIYTQPANIGTYQYHIKETDDDICHGDISLSDKASYGGSVPAKKVRS